MITANTLDHIAKLLAKDRQEAEDNLNRVIDEHYVDTINDARILRALSLYAESRRVSREFHELLDNVNEDGDYPIV